MAQQQSASIANPASERYVDDRDLDRETPIKRVTWQMWRRSHEGPPWFKVGRRCVYRWSDVVAFIERNRGSLADRQSVNGNG